MPRRRRSPTPNYETFDEDFDEDSNSNSLRLNQDPPIQRNAANARERARMRVLSSAFCRLKTKLPNIPPDTKLSKLDTLRLATIYIQQLKSLLDGETIDSDIASSSSSISLHSVNSQNLTWPFTFQQMNTNLRHNNNNNSSTISNNNNTNNNYHHRPQHHHLHHHLYHHPATNNCLDGWITTAAPTTLPSSTTPTKFSNKFYSINTDNNNSSNVIN